MTVEELIALLSEMPNDYVVYVESPDGKEDYFVDEVRSIAKQRQVFIRTAE